MPFDLVTSWSFISPFIERPQGLRLPTQMLQFSSTSCFQSSCFKYFVIIKFSKFCKEDKCSCGSWSAICTWKKPIKAKVIASLQNQVKDLWRSYFVKTVFKKTNKLPCRCLTGFLTFCNICVITSSSLFSKMKTLHWKTRLTLIYKHLLNNTFS